MAQRDSGERVASCTIIVTGANNLIEPWLTASAAGLELLWSAPNDACAFVRFRGPARSKLASVNTL